MYALNPNDSIVSSLVRTTGAKYLNTFRELLKIEDREPVIFRSMAQRKTVETCNMQQRPFYYIDTGYLGNAKSEFKYWHRVVKNNVQHTQVNYNMPDNRFKKLLESNSYLKFNSWKKNGRAILLVTPSEKPCKFYRIDKGAWIDNTIKTIKQYTDRPIIIRDKETKRENRVGAGSIYSQFVNDNIFAVVTYNSIAATEAIGFGIPCFTSAPNAADNYCLKDLSKIETPLYEDKEKIEKWQHWLAYCQYSINEMQSGIAFKLIKEYDLK